MLVAGGSQGFWGGVTKLYASHCGLRRLDGIAQLSRVIWLYLDNNQLCEAELLRLLSGGWNGRAIVLARA